MSLPPLDLAELEHEAAACRALWCSVVARLLLDAPRDNADGQSARDWLRNPDVTVLDLAGLNPGAARPVLFARATPKEPS